MEYVTFYWRHNDKVFKFTGRHPSQPGEITFLGYSFNDSKTILENSYFLVSNIKQFYHPYYMIYFNHGDFYKIENIIEPNKYLKFKEYNVSTCKWIYSTYYPY